MNYAWMCPIPLERAVARDPAMSGMFSVAGDSMLFVDKRGQRVVNEKLPYNELAQTFFRWDPATGSYPYLVLTQVWDQRAQDHSASDEYGRLIVPPGTDDAHVIKGDTLAELAAGIGERLARYEGATGGLRLSEDFLRNLEASIARFNELAAKGVDDDFHRGERAVQLLFNGYVKDEPGRANPTMWPLSGSGPYYAALVTGGTLDTNGGPTTNRSGQRRPPPRQGAAADGRSRGHRPHPGDRAGPGRAGLPGPVGRAVADPDQAPPGRRGQAALDPVRAGRALRHLHRPGR
jgi:hypothetical protein